MTAPDWLINLFILLGLKTSEKKDLQRKIIASEEKIRAINQELDMVVKEIRNIEAEYREAKAEYDRLKGVARETVKIRLDNLLDIRERFSERNILLEKSLKAETLIQHNLKLQLEALYHGVDEAEIEDIWTDKGILIDDLNESTKATEKLAKTTLKEQKEAVESDVGNRRSVPLDDDDIGTGSREKVKDGDDDSMAKEVDYNAPMADFS